MKFITIYASALCAYIFTSMTAELLSNFMFDFNITPEEKPLLYYSVIFILCSSFSVMSVIFYHIIIYFIF